MRSPVIDHSPFVVSGVDGGPVVSGVTVWLANGRSTTTDARGACRFAGVAAGDYTVTPGLAGHRFTPSTALISVASADVAVPNFAGASTGNDSTIAQALACGPTRPGGANISTA